MTSATVPPFAKIFRDVFRGETARREPLGLTARFAIWQCWRRVLRRPMTFQTLTGAKLILLPGASDSLSGFWYHRMPDFEELAFSLHLLRANDLFVDVGANQGGWSLTAAGMGARVVAFEPVPLTFERLVANIEANLAPIRNRVQALPLALSDFTGPVQFTAELDTGNHLIRGETREFENSVKVEARRMDDVLGDEPAVLIKIDVEGEELSVLRGGRNVLETPSLRAVILETFRSFNFAMAQHVAVETLLREHGFVPMAYDPWKRELRELTDPSEGTQNTIYVRGAARTLDRLKSAAPVRVFRTWL